jgi:hypothetical protein
VGGKCGPAIAADEAPAPAAPEAAPEAVPEAAPVARASEANIPANAAAPKPHAQVRSMSRRETGRGWKFPQWVIAGT